MADITSNSFDAANAGFNQLSSDTTRVYFDADLTIDDEGEPTGSIRTNFGGAFSDELPFTLVTSALSIDTTELNVMKNGTIITTAGAAGFGNTADYTFRAACNVDWDNVNFMCSNGLVNGWGLAGALGGGNRPVGQVINSTFGTTAMTGGAPVAAASFTTNTYDTGGTVGNDAGEWLYDPDCDFNTAPPSGASTITIANLVGQCFHHPYQSFGLGANPTTDDAFLDTLTWVVVRTTAGDITMNIGSRAEPAGNDSRWTVISATSDLTTTTGNNMTNVVWDFFTEEPVAGEAMPMGNWFVNLSNVDPSFVFANNALDAAVLNTANAGNYVIGLAFAGTIRQQSAGNNSYTIRINQFTGAYAGETNNSPWTIMMNNSFRNNATTPYAAGVGNAAIAHYETNNVPGGSTILMINEQFEGDAFFAAKRGGNSSIFRSTYGWNPTFITPASVTIADVKLVGVGSDIIYQVPTGATNRVSTFATQYPTITDGIVVNSSNGFLVEAGALTISPDNATSLEGTAARAFADGSLLVAPVTKRAKSYTHLVDTIITSEIDTIENTGGNSGSFSFTEESATTADVDASLVSAPIATVIAYDGSNRLHNEGAALYSRLKADWYSEDGLNESLVGFAGTQTPSTISSIHDIDLSNTVGSVSVNNSNGIIIPASAGITGDAVYNTIFTTQAITIGVNVTDMTLSATGTIDVGTGNTFSNATLTSAATSSNGGGFINFPTTLDGSITFNGIVGFGTNTSITVTDNSNLSGLTLNIPTGVTVSVLGAASTDFAAITGAGTFVSIVNYAISNTRTAGLQSVYRNGTLETLTDPTIIPNIQPNDVIDVVYSETGRSDFLQRVNAGAAPTPTTITVINAPTPFPTSSPATGLLAPQVPAPFTFSGGPLDGQTLTVMQINITEAAVSETEVNTALQQQVKATANYNALIQMTQLVDLISSDGAASTGAMDGDHVLFTASIPVICGYVRPAGTDQSSQALAGPTITGDFTPDGGGASTEITIGVVMSNIAAFDPAVTGGQINDAVTAVNGHTTAEIVTVEDIANKTSNGVGYLVSNGDATTPAVTTGRLGGIKPKNADYSSTTSYDEVL